MNLIKIMIAMIAGAAIGFTSATIGKNTSQEIEPDIADTPKLGTTFSRPWSETDMNSVIENANSSFISPSVMLVGAFGDYLLVPNRFNVRRLHTDGVRFSAGEIMDPEFGMSEYRSGSISIRNLSTDNLNANENRERRDKRANELTNCYGIDLAIYRYAVPSDQFTVDTTIMYKDDLMVSVTQGGKPEEDLDLWKRLLSRFVDKSGDDGQCLDSINHINMRDL